MGFKQFPKIIDLPEGKKYWSAAFDSFRVKVYVQKQHQLADIVNFGYLAPYLIIFEEKEMTQEEAEVIMQQPALTDEEASELFAQVAQKLEVSEKQLKAWHDMPMSTETFRSQRGLYQWGIKVFTWLGLEKRIRSN